MSARHGHPATRRTPRQGGILLIEVAIATAVIGVCAILLWKAIDHRLWSEQDQRAASMISRSHDALLAFAYLHGHLPCPAPSTAGMATCGTDDGYLPYLTLGLPAPEAGHIRYHVSTRAPTLTARASAPYPVVVAQAMGEFGDLEPRDATLAELTSHGQEALYDLCTALGGAPLDEPAYELSLRPDAGSTDTATHSLGMAPARVGRATLAARLGCAPLSAAMRSHFNAVLGARIMARAMRDYQDQFDLAFHMYLADLAQGVFFAASATYGTKRAITKMTVAKAEAEGTALLHDVPFVKAAITVGTSAIYAGAMVSNVARFSKNIVTAVIRLGTIRDLTRSTRDTADDITRRAITSARPESFGVVKP